MIGAACETVLGAQPWAFFLFERAVNGGDKVGRVGGRLLTNGD